MRRVFRIPFTARQIAREVDDELRFHLEMRVQRLVAVGNPTRVSSLSMGSPRVDLLSAPLYREIRDHNRLFSGVLASGRTGRIDVRIDSAGGELEHPRGRFISGNYFEVLNVKPAL